MSLMVWTCSGEPFGGAGAAAAAKATEKTARDTSNLLDTFMSPLLSTVVYAVGPLGKKSVSQM
jgi:hypothetical protein